MELVYRPSAADVVAAIKARGRVLTLARVMRWVCVYAAVVALLGAVLNALGGDVAGVAKCLGLAVLVYGLYALQPRVQGRQIQRMLASRGEFRTVVDDEGVRLTAQDYERRSGWPAHPRYVETSELFVLLTGDRFATGFVILPKRGLADPADVDRLRTLLDRNITRL